MDTNKQKLIGKRIRDAREQAGMSQLELGQKVGYSAMGISHLESGDRSIKIDQLQEIAKQLNVDINYLLVPVTQQIYPSILNRRGSDDLSEEEKKAEQDALKKLNEVIKNM